MYDIDKVVAGARQLTRKDRSPKQIEASIRNHKIRQIRMMHGVAASVLEPDLALGVKIQLDRQLLRLGAKSDVDHRAAILAKHAKEDADEATS